MTDLILPTFSDPYYDMRLTLGEIPYVFRFRYNTRELTWRLTILDTNQDKLIEGIKIVCGVDLLGPYKYNLGVPQGVLVALWQGADDSPPQLDDFGPGLRVQLVYVT